MNVFLLIRSLGLGFLLTLSVVGCTKSDNWLSYELSGIEAYNERNYKKAREMHLEALQLAEKPDTPPDQLVGSLVNLARVASKQGKSGLRQSLTLRAWKIAKQNFSSNDPRLLLILDNLANAYHSAGKFPDAEEFFLLSKKFREETLGRQHEDVARNLVGLGRNYIGQGKYQDAEQSFLQALKILEKNGTDRLAIAGTLQDLAGAYVRLGKYRIAKIHYDQSLAILQKFSGPESVEVSWVLNGLGDMFQKQGQYGEAESHFMQALRIREKALGNQDHKVATTLYRLGTLNIKMKKYDKAIEMLLKARKILEPQTTALQRMTLATVSGSLGFVYRQTGEYAKAEILYQDALDIFEGNFDPEGPDVAIILAEYAALYLDQEKVKMAKPLYDRSVAIWDKLLKQRHPLLGETPEEYVDFLRQEGLHKASESLASSIEVIKSNPH